MSQSSRYALPLLQSGQAQKEITHNDAVARIDVLLHLAVESRQNSGAPETTATTWIVPLEATGAWAGHGGEIAAFDDAGWSFVVPRDGCIAFVRDEGVFIHYGDGIWRDAWTVPSLSIGTRTVLAGSPVAVAGPTGGTTIDSEARAAITQLLAGLRTMGLVA